MMLKDSPISQKATDSVAKLDTLAEIRRRVRREAAKRIAERLNAPFSEHTLRMSEVPYIIVGGRALYEDADSDAYADKVLSEAPRRMGGRSPRN